MTSKTNYIKVKLERGFLLLTKAEFQRGLARWKYEDRRIKNEQQARKKLCRGCAFSCTTGEFCEGAAYLPKGSGRL